MSFYICVPFCCHILAYSHNSGKNNLQNLVLPRSTGRERGHIHAIVAKSTESRARLPGFKFLHISCETLLRMNEVAQSCPTLCDPMDCSLQDPRSMGFSRQEYSLVA